MKKHYLVLDSFRGLCASIVALCHFNAISIFSNVSLLSQAAIYVDFFFVLSGFVIFANYGEKLRQGYGMGKFVLLRFGRLYPLHFCVLVAFIAVDLLQLLIPTGGLAIYKPFSAPGEGVGDIMANILLIHSLHVSEHLAFNGPSWSISTEFYTYILFGLILVYARKFYRPLIAVLGIVSAAVLYHLHGELYAKLDYGFLRCVFGFACGALTYELFHAVNNRLQPVADSKKLSNMIEIAVFAATLLYIQFFSQEGLYSMAVPLVFGIVILVFAFEGGVLSRILKWKPFVFLGLLSYSIYMNNMFISGKFFSLPARILESKLGWKLAVPGEGGFPVFGHNLLTGTLWEIAFILTVIGCSFVTYKLIEEPGRNFTRKLAKGEIKFGMKILKARA